MASKQPFYPCLHCGAHDFRAISNLGHKVVNKGLYVNATIYTGPPVTLINFSGGLTMLDNLIVDARGNSSKKPARDTQCVLVFNDLSELLVFVKPICGHDADLIAKSGFDANVQPEKVSIPSQPVITKIIKWKEFGTYKIYLTRIVNKPDVPKDPSTHQRGITYAIEISLTPEIESSWVNVLAGVKTNNLIFNTYTPLVKNYVRVYGRNASGKGQASMTYSFIPE